MEPPHVGLGYEALRQFAIPIAIFVVFVVFAETFASRRLQFQRKWLTRIRCFLGKSLGLKGLSEIDADGFDRGQGWKTLSAILLWLTGLMVIVHAVDGRWQQSLSAFLVLIATGAAFQSSNQALIYLLWRFTLVMQMIGMVNFMGKDDKEALTRRATLIRAAASLTFEGLDECLLQMMLVGWANTAVMGVDSPVAWLPLRMFLMFSLPIIISGVRECLCSQATSNSSRFTVNKRSILVVCVPSMTFLYAFSSFEVDLRQSRFDILFAALGFAEIMLFLACAFAGRSLDDLIMPCFCAASEEEEHRHVLAYKSVLPAGNHQDPRVSDFVLTSSCVIFMATALSPWIKESPEVPQGVLSLWFYLGAVLAIVITRMALDFSSLGTTQPQKCMKHKRTLAMAAHTLVLGFALTHPLGRDIQALALATSRIPLTFEKRRFSQLQSSISLFAGISNLLMCRSQLNFMLGFVSVSTQAFCAVISLSRENVAWIVQQEKDLQSFVQHQMKQKFSGVGSAVEHILDACGNDDAKTLSPSCRNLLLSALRECRRGHDGCHIANLMRSILKGRYVSRNTTKTFKMVMTEWKNDRIASSLEISRITFDFIDDHPQRDGGEIDDEIVDIPFTLDWELLRLIMSEWFRTLDELVIELRPSPVAKVKPKYLLNLRLEGARIKDVCNHVLAKALDASFSTDESCLSLTITAEQDMLPDVTMARCRSVTPQLAKSLQATCSATSTSTTTNQTINETSSQDETSALSPMESKASLTPLFLNRELGLTVDDDNADAMVPKGLRYAVLDDNLLVRRNLERVIRVYLKGDKRSFTRGERVSEARAFPREIINNAIDVAIFDENLDYDEFMPEMPQSSPSTALFPQNGDGKASPMLTTTTTVKGSKLAIVARQLGFKGCIILHSAHADANTCSRSSHIFDGFVEKTASKHDFMKGVQAAWLNHVNSRSQVHPHLPATTTTTSIASLLLTGVQNKRRTQGE